MNEQPKMNQQPIYEYCGQGPFADLKAWALHHCYAKPQMADVIAQLRVELKAAQDKLAEIEARSCENCQHNIYCFKLINPSAWLPKTPLTSCSAHKQKEPAP